MANTMTGKFSGTAVALGTIKDTAGKTVLLKITAGGAETVSVTGSVAGSAVSSKIVCYSLLTGALHSTVDMGSGSYYIVNCPTGNLMLLGSAAVEAKVVDFIVTEH